MVRLRIACGIHQRYASRERGAHRRPGDERWALRAHCQRRKRAVHPEGRDRDWLAPRHQRQRDAGLPVPLQRHGRGAVRRWHGRPHPAGGRVLLQRSGRTRRQLCAPACARCAWQMAVARGHIRKPRDDRRGRSSAAASMAHTQQGVAQWASARREECDRYGRNIAGGRAEGARRSAAQPRGGGRGRHGDAQDLRLDAACADPRRRACRTSRASGTSARRVARGRRLPRDGDGDALACRFGHAVRSRDVARRRAGSRIRRRGAARALAGGTRSCASAMACACAERARRQADVGGGVLRERRTPRERGLPCGRTLHPCHEHHGEGACREVREARLFRAGRAYAVPSR